MNRVLPVEDLSIRMPLILNLYSFFTGMHTWPFRMVLKWSDMHSLLARMTASAFSRILSCARRMSPRRFFSSLEALSETCSFQIWYRSCSRSSSRGSRFSS